MTIKQITIITGQTATGKTKLALKLAKKYNADIISADSRQIYKYLDIITGKDIGSNKSISRPKLKDVKLKKFNISYYLVNNIKIWGLDIIKPDRYFSSYNYCLYVQNLINNIIERERKIIVTGGTYLYIKHLLYGIDTEGIEPDWNLRNELNLLPIQKLQEILKNQNITEYKSMNNSDKNNPRRLIRKIEITKQEKPQTDLKNMTIQITKFIGLQHTSKDKLRKIIKNRVKTRIKIGAIEEVKQLLNKGYAKKDPGLNTIGYSQIIAYLNNEISYKEAIDQWILKEVQYAARQLTFMKKGTNIEWRNV